MNRGVLAALALATISAGVLALLPTRQADVPDRPRLALLTSLPLLMSESFELDAPTSDAVERLKGRFRIVPIAVADQASLESQSLLLMAHPRAQPAEALVELDQWVRRGGSVVLLADPLLQWQSARPLGDRLRPPPDFADTGLLDHWGLRLAVDEAGEGVLRATGSSCGLSEKGLIARCRIGRGRASVIADSDFLMGEGPGATRRLDLMMAELAAAKPR